MHKRAAVFSILLMLLFASSLTWLSARDVAAQTGEEQNGLPEAVQVGGLEMAVKAGFGKLAVSTSYGSWVPFRISLANQGAPINGRLIVRTESQPNPSPQVREFTKDIQLPTGARQLHEITAYVNSAHKETEVILLSDGQEAAKVLVKVERTYYSNEQLDIGVIDTDATTLNHLGSVEIFRPPNRAPFKGAPAQPTASPNANAANQTAASPTPPPAPPTRRRRGWGSNQQGPTAHPVVFPAEDMPRDFVSYDSLDVVVLGDAPLSQLTEEQSRALRLWVAAGGFLIVTGGADIAGLRAAGLDAILPVEAQGTTSSATLDVLTATYGRFESSESLLAISAHLRDGARLLLGTSDRVIAAEKTYGSGLVRFVAINPKLNPYRGWASAKDLWTDLLLPAIETQSRQTNWLMMGRRWSPRSNTGGGQNALFKLADIKPPSANYFLLFLLAYILTVGPINYFALKWVKKLDWAWVTIPAVVLLFTTASVITSEIGRGGGSVAAEITLVELHQPERIARDMAGVLVMPSAKGVQEITLAGTDVFARDSSADIGPSGSSNGAIEVENRGQDFQFNVPVNTWSAEMFEASAVREVAAPLVALSEGGESGGGAVKVKNLSGVPISKAALIGVSGVSELFDLAPGAEQEIKLNTPQSSSFINWYSMQLEPNSLEQQTFDDLSAALEYEISGEAGQRQLFYDSVQMPNVVPLLQRPILVAFVDDTPIKITFKSSIKRQGRTLYVVHL